MKFFVDTAEVNDIRELNDLGLIDGVTTNPSLILKSGGKIAEVTKQICDIVAGPVSAEVTATEYTEMMAQAKVLAKIADNICNSRSTVPAVTLRRRSSRYAAIRFAVTAVRA